MRYIKNKTKTIKLIELKPNIFEQGAENSLCPHSFLFKFHSYTMLNEACGVYVQFLGFLQFHSAWRGLIFG